MGGCKCVFRDCKVNTARNPKMHFFKFPIREKERFMKWIEISGAKEILYMSPSQQANRAVCVRHFRDECFMNYKKDRLCANQIPTITRLGPQTALDYQQLDSDGLPQFILLDRPTLPHLIPPDDFECPMDFSDREELNLFTCQRKTEKLVTTMQNVIKRSYLENVKVKAVNEEEKAKRFCDSSATNSKSIVLGNMQKQHASMHEIQVWNEISLTSTHLEDSCNNAENMELKTLRRKILKSNETIAGLRASLSALESAHEDLRVQYSQQEDCCKNLQRKLDQFQLEQADQQSQKAITAECTPASKQMQPSKGQLYLGIKKYLNPSMATLLRMEMFGNPERPWKSDEKQLSADLLSLGENIYQYFIEEWRLRLPALREVRNWEERGESLIE